MHDKRKYIKQKKQRVVGSLKIITTNPYEFFDGATNRTPNTCKAGRILIISIDHKIQFECGSRQGTNNYTKVKDATILMSIV
jgi:hypothetical protein